MTQGRTLRYSDMHYSTADIDKQKQTDFVLPSTYEPIQSECSKFNTEGEKMLIDRTPLVIEVTH